MCNEVPWGTLGEQMLFFLAQPPIIWAQRRLTAALAPLWQRRVVAPLPPPARAACEGAARAAQTLVTLGLVLATGEAFFWGAFEKRGCSIDAKGLGEIRGLLDWATGHAGVASGTGGSS